MFQRNYNGRHWAPVDFELPFIDRVCLPNSLKGMSVMLSRLPCFLLCFGFVLAGPVFSVVVAAPPKVAPKPAPKASAKEEEHEHAEVGTHKGALIELGDEEYHAEILFDEDKDLVTIYLLDGHAKEAVALDAKDIAINLKHDGKGAQFKLKAQPQKVDPEGKSSRYSSKSHDLMHAIHEMNAAPKLSLKIKGKTYTGTIDPHAHDHEHEAEKKTEKK
jgi:hypothetical protein